MMSYEYDLNSAYPHFIAQLPCLLHGTYSRGTGDPPYSNPRSIVLVNVTATASNIKIGPVPHRTKDGHILRPLVSRGWHWLSEIRAAISSGLIGDIEYHEWAKYNPCKCKPPARGVQGLYEHRLAVGKASVMGVAAKLIYNSMYGKFAQSIGEAPYGNWVYASLITSGCRTEIIKAIGSHPGGIDSLLMVATDGVFFDSPHPGLPLSNRLGEWEETTRNDLTQFKPGVYWDDRAREAIRDDKPVKFKARGINARKFQEHIASIDSQFACWFIGEKIPESRTDIYLTKPEQNRPYILAQAEQGWPAIVFRIGFSMTSVVQALEWNNWREAGQVSTENVAAHTSSPYDKRENPHWNFKKERLETDARELKPEDIQTTYYEKGIWDEPWAWDFKESKGIYFDAPMPDMISEYMRMLTQGGV